MPQDPTNAAFARPGGCVAIESACCKSYIGRQGCPFNRAEGYICAVMTCEIAPSVEDRLRLSGLRPTRQRVALADLLFAKGDRHLTVEELHEEAQVAGVPVSLATVYNTLHQFTEAGLIRVLAVEGARTYFDTNVSDHHHFFVEGRAEVLDIPVNNIEIGNLPEPPEGMEIAHVDVVIRLRPKA
ncbi:Fur family transcriptional regulator, iron response regulator [Rhizobium sp. RU20A]|nr:Fur family transcriptional regulator, iron response regulator [Rhizobium sp. RU20A]